MTKKITSTTPAAQPTLLERITKVIDERIRPYIQMDGGEIELIELTPEKILKVKLHGACNGCMASSVTLQYGVQQAIDDAFPEEDIELQLVDNGVYAEPHLPPTR